MINFLEQRENTTPEIRRRPYFRILAPPAVAEDMLRDIGAADRAQVRGGRRTEHPGMDNLIDPVLVGRRTEDVLHRSLGETIFAL